MRARSIAIVSLLVTALGALAGPRTLVADERADRVARELIASLGGEAAWDKARQLRFDFAVEREGKRAAEFRHLWDRYTGDYRLHGTDKSGAPYVVYFNVNSREGTALVNGRPVEGEEKKKLLETAYGRFINDTYWLLAPWKVFDPGVVREYAGEKTGPEGVLCDVIRLSSSGSTSSGGRRKSRPSRSGRTGGRSPESHSRSRKPSRRGRSGSFSTTSPFRPRATTGSSLRPRTHKARRFEERGQT